MHGHLNVKFSRKQRRTIVSKVLNYQMGYMNSSFRILLTNEMITASYYQKMRILY